jgi:hypothetical protein
VKNKSKKQERVQALSKTDVKCSATRPPLGLIPKKIHDERVKMERFNEVCGAISRYYNAGLKIKHINTLSQIR